VEAKFNFDRFEKLMKSEWDSCDCSQAGCMPRMMSDWRHCMMQQQQKDGLKNQRHATAREGHISRPPSEEPAPPLALRKQVTNQGFTLAATVEHTGLNMWAL
jgi:hypothetical protein